MKSLSHIIAVHPSDVKGNKQDCGQNDKQVSPDLRELECLFEFLHQQYVVEGKIDTKQNHKDGDYILQVR